MIHSSLCQRPDLDGGRQLLGEELRLRKLELICADGVYTRGFREWAEEKRGWRVEVPYHRDRQLWRYGSKEKSRGFRVLPRRWVVERKFAWLGLARRLDKDYERLPETAEAMIYGAMSRLMLHRLAGVACRYFPSSAPFYCLSNSSKKLSEKSQRGLQL